MYNRERTTANYGAWFQIGTELLRCQNTVVVYAFENVTIFFLFVCLHLLNMRRESDS